MKGKSDCIKIGSLMEAIIIKEDFENVQKLLKIDTRASNGTKKAHLFSGLLFCGDCKEPMIRRVSRYKETEKVCFICSTKNKGWGCTRHSIAENELKKIVLIGLKSQVELFIDKSKVLSNIERLEINFEEIRQLDQEMVRLIKEQKQYLALRNGLDEDLKNGVITQNDFYAFRSIYEEKYVKTQEAITGQEEMIRSCFKSSLASGIKLEQFKKVLELTELTRDVLITFIEKIIVFEEKRICIQLKAKELFTKVVMLEEYFNRKE